MGRAGNISSYNQELGEPSQELSSTTKIRAYWNEVHEQGVHKHVHERGYRKIYRTPMFLLVVYGTWEALGGCKILPHVWEQILEVCL